MLRGRLIDGTKVRPYHQSHPFSSACAGGRPAGGRPAPLAATIRQAGAALAAALCSASLAGCAVSVPIATLSNASDDVTGSIASAPLQKRLSDEDWRRAKAALDTALDPQGNGSLVAWDNPQTGAKGSFEPTGAAYPEDDRICRAFRTRVARSAAPEAMEGVACADKSGEWTISSLRAAKA